MITDQEEEGVGGKEDLEGRKERVRGVERSR